MLRAYARGVGLGVAGLPGLGLDVLAVKDYEKQLEGVGAYTGLQGS